MSHDFILTSKKLLADIASSMETTGLRVLYWTFTKEAAWRASFSVLARIAPIGCPSKSTSPSANISSSTRPRILNLLAPSGMSLADMNFFTPGRASAADSSTETIVA